MVSYNKAQKTINTLLGQRFKEFLAGKYDFDYLSTPSSISLDKEVIYVPMDYFDVTSATSNKPRIGTSSLASCAGIAIYDPTLKVGGVAHVFFNEKEQLIIYDHDLQGIVIPSTGRAIIINNPHPFAPFGYLAESLIRKANSLGANQYYFYAFNIQHGCRTAEQNKQLEQKVESTIDHLKSQGRINSFTYLHEQAFVLDTRNGDINGF